MNYRLSADMNYWPAANMNYSLPRICKLLCFARSFDCALFAPPTSWPGAAARSPLKTSTLARFPGVSNPRMTILSEANMNYALWAYDNMIIIRNVA